MADETPPPVQLLQLLSGFVVTKLLHTVAELEVADHLADGPRPVADLAAAVGADAGHLRRALRTLAMFGVFDEVQPNTFALTAVGATLCSGPGSLRDMVLMWSRDHYVAFAELPGAVRTGTNAFSRAFPGEGTWWDHLARNPEEGQIFNRAMGNLVGQFHAAAVELIDFSAVEHVVDVGGGQGQLVSALLGHHPDLRATVFDQPHVVDGAEKVLAGAGVLERADLAAGDFFEAVPAGGDCYLLSMILHDWDDDECVAILRNVARAMKPNGRVIVGDAVVPEGNAVHFAKIIDIVMLAMLTGHERTEAEFADLFERAGLQLVSVTPTHGPTSVLEARPTPRRQLPGLFPVN